MNAPVPPGSASVHPDPSGPGGRKEAPHARRPLHRFGATRADKEFLPAALEILERPASPVALAFLVGICVFAVTALAWAWIGQTDIVAVGHGKVQPLGKVKIVQPLEPGKVKAILAVNGASVAEGDPLVELDPDEALAELRAAQAAFVSWTAEALRRADAVAAAAQEPVIDRPRDWPAAIPAAIRTREDAVRAADLRRLAGDLAALDAQAAQKKAERQRLVNTIAAEEALIATQQERLDMRSSLLSTKAGTKASVIDAAESLNTQRTVLAGQRGQLAETESALETIAAERDKTSRAFIAEHAAKMAEAQRQADEAEQRLARARIKLGRMTLRSPAAGTVQASSVTSLGQVLVAGQEVMRVVPQDAELEVEVYLENKDIGFVEAGQPAVVKVEAFPFTRYGVLPARVVRVGKDAIPEPDARQAEGDPTRPADTRTATGADRVRNLVFPVVLRPDVAHVIADGRAIPLTPGMAVTAEIVTGKRRILDYLLSPVQSVTSEAMRER